jgi:methanogenic corrinoid protein MtbC1
MPTGDMLRRRIALRVRQRQGVLASRVADAWAHAHPGWFEALDAHARQMLLEDAENHLAQLAVAIAFDAPEEFGAYLRWAAGVLATRGVGRCNMDEVVDLIESALAPDLTDEERRVLAPHFVSARRALAAPAPSGPAAVEDGWTLAQRVFLQALLGGHRQAALAVVEGLLREGRPIEDLYLRLVQDSLHQVGRLWETNAISVADEHMATALAQYVVGRLYTRLPPAVVSRGRMVLAGVAGELHQVGANIVADLLEADGWVMRFLGTNVPHSGIVASATAHEAAVVGISATMLVNLPRVADIVRDLKALPKPPVIVVGGAAFQAAPRAWRETGADLFAADARLARQELRQLSAGGPVR